MAQDERRRAFGLEPEHARQCLDLPRVAVGPKARPVSADVAGVAYGDGQNVGRRTQVVADLEGSGLLSLQPVRVDRVHQRDGVRRVIGELPYQCERLVEVAIDGDHVRSGDEGLQQLAERDLTARQDDDNFQAGRSAIGGRRCRGVAGRSADQGFGAILERPGDGNHHSPVLEAARGVLALDLQEQPRQPELGPQAVGMHERREALAQREGRGRITDRKKPAISFSAPTMGPPVIAGRLRVNGRQDRRRPPLAAIRHPSAQPGSRP